MHRAGWIALNLLGMALYLAASKPIIGNPEETGPGDGLYFAFAVLPILISCLLLNTWVLYKAALPLELKASSRAFLAWAVAGMLWFAVMRNAQQISQWLS